MAETTGTRQAAEAALAHYVEIADRLSERRAAMAFAEATAALRRERAEKRREEKAALEKAMREAEATIADCDRKQAELSQRIAEARQGHDEEKAHRYQLESQGVVWRKQEAVRKRSGLQQGLTQYPEVATWGGRKADLWREWRCVDFGPDHAEVYALLTTGDFADLPEGAEVTLRYRISDGSLVEHHPKPK